MSDFETQFNKKTAATKLTAAEKRELKARVVSYMEYHPRRETVAKQKAEAYLESQPYTVLNFNNLFVRGFMGAFAVFMVAFVPSLAERAVPGDVLYPIKVNVNEEIRSTLTFSTADRVAWETQRLERRISEVRLLADEGRLTAEVEAAAAVAVKEHAEAAQDGINELETTDADEALLAQVAFDSALEVQSVALDASEEENEATDEVVTIAIASAVREAKEVSEANKVDAKPAAEKVAARIEQQTTRAYELFASLEDKVATEERAEIERRLQDIERAIALATGTAAPEVATVPVAAAEIATFTEPESEVAEPEAAAESENVATTTEVTDTELAASSTPEAAAEEEVEVEEVAASTTEDSEEAAEVAIETEAEETSETPEAETQADESEALLVILSDIQKLISFMTDLDIRQSVELEELVPVVYTTQEREAAISEAVTAATTALAQVAEVTTSEAVELEEGLIEKIDLATDTMTDQLAQLEATVEIDGVLSKELSLADREAIATELTAYTADVEALILPYLDALRVDEVTEEEVVVEEEENPAATTTVETTQESADTDSEAESETETDGAEAAATTTEEVVAVETDPETESETEEG